MDNTQLLQDLKTANEYNYFGELRHMAAYTGKKPSAGVLAARRLVKLLDALSDKQFEARVAAALAPYLQEQ